MIQVTQISRPRSLKEWYDYKDKINLSPSYQRRGSLWNQKSKRLLINTILNQYDFPKIYFADFSFGDSPLNENKTLYAVIDGKQRLGTIFEFFEDGFALDDENIFYDGKSINLSGFNYSRIAYEYPKLAQMIDSYTPTIMSVITDDFEAILQMFIRLNNNTPISGPERRNAMPGPLPTLYRDIATHPFIKSFCSFNVSRGQDYNLVSKLLYMEEAGDIVATKKSDLDSFTVRFKDANAEKFKDSYRKVENVLTELTSIFVEKDRLLKSQNVVPIYYWFIRGLINFDPVRVYDFLGTFEGARKSAKTAASQAGSSANILDNDMVRYNILFRTPDDRTSLQGMYDILLDKWKTMPVQSGLFH